MQTILFVCTGNTCRSVMSEALFKHILKNKKDEFKDIEIMSAGICAWEGDKASPGAVEVLKEKGIDVMEHSSRPLVPELIDKADLVLTMTLNHKRAVLYMCPEAKKKVYTLKEYVLNDDSKELQLNKQDISPKGVDYDIKDPYGQSVDIYRESAEEIEKHLQMLINKIFSK